MGSRLKTQNWKSETADFGPFHKSQAISYYKNGLKASFTDPSGLTQTYTYDAANRLQSLNLPGQGALTWSQYTAGGQPGRLTLPGGHRIDYTYDMVQRPVQITAQTVAGTQLMTRGYAFNSAGNIDQQTKDGVPLTYGYDALNQLTQTPEGAIAYDPMGNRQNNPGTTAPWTVNAHNQVTHDGVQSYGYNANGSLTLATSASLARTFSYNPEGRLSNVSQNGQSVASYHYDVFNRRVKKVVAPAQGTVMPTTTYYLYSDEGLLAEYDESGNELRAYGWKPHGTWGTDPVFLRSPNSSTPNSSLITFYLTDHLGTPQKLVAATGQTVWSASYDTFGRATVAPESTVENHLRFPGQYFDAETGWHYNWHRYYIPELGRYNRIDPIKDDRNWYGYVSNNPGNAIDPLGLQNQKPGSTAGYIVENGTEGSNCLGYALTGNGHAVASPWTGNSMDEFLKSLGWTCVKVKHQDECKSDCDHDKIVVFTNSDDTFYGKRPDGGAPGWDFHAIRATKGCSDKYREVNGAKWTVGQNPEIQPWYRKAYHNLVKGGIFCCTKPKQP